jgi:hypothetical protein
MGHCITAREGRGALHHLASFWVRPTCGPVPKQAAFHQAASPQSAPASGVHSREEHKS